MLEYPNDIDEAKAVISNSANDELERYNRRRNWIREGIICGVCFGIAALLWLISGRFRTFLSALPLAAMISFTGLFPLFHNRSVRKRIESGRIFEGRADEELIDAARSYVDEFNAFEQRQESDRRRKRDRT